MVGQGAFMNDVPGTRVRRPVLDGAGVRISAELDRFEDRAAPARWFNPKPISEPRFTFVLLRLSRNSGCL